MGQRSKRRCGRREGLVERFARLGGSYGKRRGVGPQKEPVLWIELGDRHIPRPRDRRLRGQRRRLRGRGGEGFLGQGDPRESFRSGTEPIEYRTGMGSVKAGLAGLREGSNWESFLK